MKRWFAKKTKAKRNKYTGMTEKEKKLKCTCQLGHVHRSVLEKRVCNELNLQKRTNQIKDFKVEVSYPYVLNGIKICTHIVDFEIITNDMRIIIKEAKGKKTALWSVKHKLFKVLYPDIEYQIITAKDLKK